VSSPSAEREDAALRVVIVDDEPLARDCVRDALGRDPSVSIVAECADGIEAVEAIRRLAPDLVFLDVQLPGMDGFEVVERIGVDDMPPVVFVTGFDTHAMRAFRIHALDFVLKPFDDARFLEALDHARDQIRLRLEGQLGRRLSALLADLRAPAPAVSAEAEPGRRARRFTVRHDERIYFVGVDEVDWFEGDRNYVALHVREHTYRIRASLRALQQDLEPGRFARIHRSTIVNLSRIKEVQPWFGGDYIAILHSGQQLRISRTYAAAVLKPWQ
jgi:two-component system LytT family response regulator